MPTRAPLDREVAALLAVIADYRAEIEPADAVIVATPADAPPRWWPEAFGGFRLHDLREVIDGHQRLVLDEGRPRA